MRFLRDLVALLTSATLLAPGAIATPTCPDEATRAACGGKVIAPPLQSVAFLQYGLEYKAALDAIEGIAPEIVDVWELGRSYDDHPIYVARVTDESEEGPKRQVALSLAVHGNERAGAEGGLRYLEDLATWWSNDRQRLLYTGDESRPLDEVLAETEVYFAILNPDGWADGDHPGSYSRGNGSGADLNRDFPNIGWTGRNQLAQPESRAWAELVSSFPNLTTASDIHGELTSANDAFADIMYPAAQWTPTQQAQELQFAQHMTRSIERQFEQDGVVLQMLFDTVGRDQTMKPANFATAFDVVGYDDSGFMGDWFAQQGGAVELDVEAFLSHTVPNNIWFGPLEQAHVSAVKGIIESVIVESMVTDEVEAGLDLGAVAYVSDPRRLDREEGQDSNGRPLAAYSASRMDYFEDLAAEVGSPVVPIPAEEVATAALGDFDSIVLVDDAFPPTIDGSELDRDPYIESLLDFASDGGQLVLTDGAVDLLGEAGLFASGDIRKSDWQGGKVDFGALDHDWESNLDGVVNQTYYAVPLGYRSGSSTRHAPNWGVRRAAWEAAGGVVVGTVDSGTNTTVNLGELEHGNGAISIFGSILPTQRTSERHELGLADYAVTVTGGQVLHSILEYRRPAV